MKGDVEDGCEDHLDVYIKETLFVNIAYFKTFMCAKKQCHVSGSALGGMRLASRVGWHVPEMDWTGRPREGAQGSGLDVSERGRASMYVPRRSVHLWLCRLCLRPLLPFACADGVAASSHRYDPAPQLTCGSLPRAALDSHACRWLLQPNMRSRSPQSPMPGFAGDGVH